MSEQHVNKSKFRIGSRQTFTSTLRTPTHIDAADSTEMLAAWHGILRPTYGPRQTVRLLGASGLDAVVALFPVTLSTRRSGT